MIPLRERVHNIRSKPVLTKLTPELVPAPPPFPERLDRQHRQPDEHPNQLQENLNPRKDPSD